MNTNLIHSCTKNDRDELFQEISRGVEEWANQGNEVSGKFVEHSICGYLRRYLRRTSSRPFVNTIQRAEHATNCNLVIDGQIGIKIIKDLTAGSKEWIHKQIRSLFQEYDRLILYGHQIPERYMDTWNQIKRSARRYVKHGQCITAFATINRRKIVIPLTNIEIAKKSLSRTLIYAGFFVFLLASGHFMEVAGNDDVMGGAYVGGVLVFNLVAILLAGFLVRYL